MTNTWLIVNEASGSYDPAVIADLVTWFAQAHQPVDCIIRCPADTLPSPERLRAEGVKLLAIFAGDGTINSALESVAGWDGPVLILPGGTMNLLAKALHGDQSCDAIIASACKDPRTRKLNTVTVGDHTAYVGVIAGPTTSWAKVREGARHNEVADLVFNAIPAAIAESLSGPEVGLEGDARTFPAIFAAPRDDMLSLRGFTATGVGEIWAHANAWMSGDFREGPHVELQSASHVVLVSDAISIGLLIDGEPAECRPGDSLTLNHAPHEFVYTRTDQSA